MTKCDSPSVRNIHHRRSASSSVAVSILAEERAVRCRLHLSPLLDLNIFGGFFRCDIKNVSMASTVNGVSLVT